MTAPTPFTFACPDCQTPLRMEAPNLLICPSDQAEYRRVDGIWRMLPEARAAYYASFIQDYETVRQGEGRGSEDLDYYRALPFQDLSGEYPEDWSMRAQSYKTLVTKLIEPLEAKNETPMKILDLGAGNGWLSNCLTQRGHQVAAVDIVTNTWDGLGTHAYYQDPYTPIQAEFNHLPLTAEQVDLIIFNASFHYSTDYNTTLTAALRVSKPAGVVAILDTPLYHRASSGEQMVTEREAHFLRSYGVRSNALPFENYLTYQRLISLGYEHGLSWKFYYPFYGVRWLLRPIRARLLGRREPARFGLIISREVE